MNQLIANFKSKSYPIVFYNSFDKLDFELEKLNIDISSVFIITDNIVDDLYSDLIVNNLKRLKEKTYIFKFPFGEDNKNLTTINDAYSFLLANKADRKSLIVALGGGVVGDMAGFVAATYMRGLKFIQIPTTLLSQVDSSIGGKTGVDFKGYKNIIGSFYQPELVYINTNTLNTLAKKQFNSGMAEVIKHGLILDRDYFNEIEYNISKIKELDDETIKSLIYKSCIIKSKIVSEDEKEEGVRALLNLGHTIGHGIEKLKNFELLHGECISIGIIAILYISLGLGHINEDTLNRIKNLFINFDLPISIEGLNPKDIYNELFLDKKTTNNNLNFILLKDIGRSYINNNLDEKIVLDGIGKIIK